MPVKATGIKAFMHKKSECSRIIAGIDWARHPLGKPATWPQSLITALSIMLNSKFPMFLFWGKGLYCFYNDAYRPSLGNEGKHPDAMGKKAKEVWPEVWDVIYPQIKQVMAGGDATWHEDMLVPIYRNGKIEDVYWTYSYSPVFGEAGNIAGVFVTCNETTAKVMSEKKLIRMAKELELKAKTVTRNNNILQKNLERLNKAEQFAHFGGFEWEIDTGKITWSDELYRIAGYEPGSVKPNLNFALDHNNNPAEKERILKELEHCIATQKPFNEIFAFTRNDGSERIIKINGIVEVQKENKGPKMTGVIIDITEQERLENEKLELAGIIQNSLNEIYIFDAETLQFRFANRGALSNIGYSMDEFQMLTPLAIKPEYTESTFREMIIPLLKGNKKIIVFNTIHQRKDGSRYPVEVHLQKMTYQHKPVLVAIIIDISLQQKILQQREQERLENEALINSTSDSMWSVDPSLNLITANQSFINNMLAVTGRTIRRGDKLLLTNYFPASLIKEYKTAYKKALSGEKINIEIRNPLAAGKANEWTALSLNPIKNNDEITGIACFAQDITQTKNSTLKLQESENKYKLLFQNSPLPKLMYELDTLRIVDVNDAALKKYGYTKAEFFRLKMKDLRPAHAVKYFLAQIKKLKAGHNISSIGPTSHQKKDGTVFTVEVYLHKVQLDNKEAVIAVIQDITEKQVYENKLKQLNESLMQSNRELQQFASVTAHDLQEPLRMISNFTGRLEKKYGDKLDKKGLQYIYYAKDGAIRMQRLITDILEYAKVDGHPSDFQEVNIDSIIQQVLKDLQHRIKNAGAVINYPGYNVAIMGNAYLLYRLFMNLISNGLKFTLPDRAPEITINLQEKEKHWQFSIADNGIGIAAEDQEKLFLTFSRLHSRQAFEGSGLGLATCKKIIEQHKGRIWLKSAEGKGTTFYFTIEKF